MNVQTEPVPSLAFVPTIVRKRDGKTTEPFLPTKIDQAIRCAWEEAEGVVDEVALKRVTDAVTRALLTEEATVEQIQDAVEVSLMRLQRFAVAKAYILHRKRRAEARAARKRPDPRAVGDYIHASKYARYVPALGRREVYEETVARVEAMHLKKFAAHESLLPEIRDVFDLVRDKRVLPSMRTMQFGGAAVEANNCRSYNCSATLIDRPRAFAEAMFLLLSGCGVGYSVQFDHVEKLPALVDVDEKKVVHHVVQDTIEGWADALDALVQGYLTGCHVEFAYNLIRPAGTPLKTSGGRAPGHQKLKLALERVRAVLHGARGRKLRPIECHRMLCHAADAVLSGGIRRSAMICLFSLEDSELMNVKADRSWFDKEPWLANANNSVVLKRDEVKRKQFRRIFEMTKNFGEPGVFFVNDYDHVTNPCCEINLQPTIDGKTGWAMCNLTEINASKLTSLDDFLAAAHAATLIGTLQAAYTDMPYLGPVTEAIVRRDALLGVGMTGMQDSPAIACNPEYQRTVAKKVVEWNAHYAALIGINAAARTTCVKPSGTTSLELGNVGSGIHPHHARRYIRRVTADDLEVVFQKFRESNPSLCVMKPDGKWVVEFPVEAPDGAVLKEHLTATQFLDIVRSTQLSWVKPGTARGDANHNVSNTATVRAGEWDLVSDYLWQNRADFTGVSLLPDTGDVIYPFAPFEAVKTEAQERRWNELVAAYKRVDYASLLEAEDDTNLAGELACAGGSCTLA